MMMMMTMTTDGWMDDECMNEIKFVSIRFFGNVF